MPQMAVGRGKRRRPYHRSCGAGEIHCTAPEEDLIVGPVPLPDIAGPGNSTGGGPDGGMPGGRRNPAFFLSLPPSFYLQSCPSP